MGLPRDNVSRKLNDQWSKIGGKRKAQNKGFVMMKFCSHIPAGVVSLICLLLTLASADETSPTTVARIVSDLDAAQHKWIDLPPESQLPLHVSNGSERKGKVGIIRLEQGVRLYLSFTGKPIDFSVYPEQLKKGPRIEILISSLSSPKLPPIGWFGRLDGDIQIRNSGECAGLFSDDNLKQKWCNIWFSEQLEYRAKLGHLFTRKWLIGDSIAIETEATEAFSSLTPSLQAKLAPFDPKWSQQQDSGPIRLIEAQSSDGLKADDESRYVIDLSPDTLPPLDTNEVREIAISVRLIDEGDVDLTTTTTKTPVSIVPPIRFKISECNTPPMVKVQEGFIKGWFNPGAYVYRDGYHEITVPKNVTGLFAFDQLYHWGIYELGGFSPVLVVDQPFEKNKYGLTVCGPKLSIKRGEQIQDTDIEIGESVEILKLPSGDVLLRDRSDRLDLRTSKAYPQAPLKLVVIPQKGDPLDSYSNTDYSNYRWTFEFESPWDANFNDDFDTDDCRSKCKKVFKKLNNESFDTYTFANDSTSFYEYKWGGEERGAYRIKHCLNPKSLLFEECGTEYLKAMLEKFNCKVKADGNSIYHCE